MSALDDLANKIKNLKENTSNFEQASSFASSQLEVALSNFGDASDGGFVYLAAKYAVGQIKNVDWDPKDHPRDPHTGQFMKTLGGFIFGKTKSAEFKTANSNLHLQLPPGSVAFKTPAGNVLVSHPDGSWSIHTKNSKGGFSAPSAMPAGSHSNLADKAANGEFQKIAENPGVKVEATTQEQAAQKLEHPEEFQNVEAPDAPEAPDVTKFDASVLTENGITDPPPLKSGKTTHTAKQYATYQQENAGKFLATGANGLPVTSGSWIDHEGKPYLVHASPVGKGAVSVYRWVSTKQQASNLVKEDFFSIQDLENADSIEDPTGKPYGVIGVVADAPEAAEVKPATGSLMSQAVVGAVPNVATAHKKFGLENVGKPLVTTSEGSSWPVTSKNGQILMGGDWVEVEGKPYKVLHSPNPGNVALAKWVSTKHQASNNTYDFPVNVLFDALAIKDPSGKKYEPYVAPAEGEAEPATAISLVGDYESGKIGEEDLLSIAEYGDADASKVAKEALSQITQSVEDENLKSMLNADDVWYASSEDLQKVLPHLPEGTLLALLGNNGLVHVLAQGDGEYKIAHLTDGDVNAASIEPSQTVSSFLSSTYSSTGVYPAGSLGLAEYLASGITGPNLETAFFGEVLVKKENGLWVTKAGKEVHPSVVANVEKALVNRKKLDDFLASASIGDNFSFEYQDSIFSGTMKEEPGVWSLEETDGFGNFYQSTIDAGETSTATHGDFFPGSSLSYFLNEATYTEHVELSPELSGESGAVFVHPVSGLSFPLKQGDIVHKHKSIPNVFIIERPDDEKPIHFFNQHGKQYLPKETQKNLATGYSVVDEWPGNAGDGDSPDFGGVPLTKDLIDSAVPGDKIVTSLTLGGEAYPSTLTKQVGGHWDSSNAGQVTNQDVDSINALAGLEATFYPNSLNLAVSGPATPQHVLMAEEGASVSFTSTGWGVENTTLYTKTSSKSTGNWVDGNGLWLTPMEMLESLKSENPQYHPPVKEEKAPWGGDAAVKDKPATKPKKVKKPATAISSSYTSKDGVKHDLTPGQWVGELNGVEFLYKNPPTANLKYAALNAKFSSLTEGSSLQNLPDEVKSATPAAAKSYTKKNGLLHVDFPVKKVDMDEALSGFVAEEYDFNSASSVHSYISKVVANDWGGTGYILQNYWGGIQSYSANPKFPEKHQSELSIEENLSLIADYAPVSATAYVTLSKGRAELLSKDLFDSSDKIHTTKALKGLEFMYRSSLLAQQFLMDEPSWSDEDMQQELFFLNALAEKSTTLAFGQTKISTSVPTHQITNNLVNAYNQHKFKKSLTGLDFDPYTASSEDFVKYASENGQQHLSLLSEEHQKTWTLLTLGDPVSVSAYGSSGLNNLNKKIEFEKFNVNAAAISASIQKSAAPTSPTAAKPLSAKTELRSSYTIEGKQKIKHISPNEWEMSEGDETTSLTDAEVIFLVTNALEQGSVISASKDLAYENKTAEEHVKELLAKHGHSTAIEDSYSSDLKLVAVSEGAPSNLPVGSSAAWLTAHAVGDEISKFAIAEYFSGTDAPEHPGNPIVNPAAWKVFASLLPSHFSTSPADARREMVREILVDSWKVSPNFFGAYCKHAVTALTFNPHLVQLAKDAHTAPIQTGLAEKPHMVEQHHWDTTMSVNSMGDVQKFAEDADLMTSFKEISELSSDDLYSKFSLSGYVNQGFNPDTVQGTPDYLLRFFLLADTSSAGKLREQYAKAILARTNSGEFLEEATPVWVAPNGVKVPIAPGAEVYQEMGSTSSTYIIKSPVGSTMMMYTLDGSKVAPSYYSSYITNEQSYKKLFTMPALTTWEKAQSDNPSLMKSYWDESVKVEKGQSVKFSSDLFGSLLTKEMKSNDLLKSDYPSLYAQHKVLPDQVRQAVVVALGDNNLPMLDVLEYKAQKGHFGSLKAEGMFGLSQPWTSSISKGQMSADAISQHWPTEAKSAFAQYFSIENSDSSIAEYISNALTPPQAAVIAAKVQQPENLNLTWYKSKSKGAHSGEIWVDQDGNEWMSKAFPNDPNSKYRVDAETAANQIGTLFGFGAPKVGTVDVKKLSGNHSSSKNYGYAYIQHLKPAKYDFAGVSPSNLTDSQLGQALSEHVIDWITSNHDSHSGNLMLGVDDKVFGIDKGQAWKFFPNDKLAHGYFPSGNGAPVWYDQFYAELKAGKVSKERADEVTKHVLRTAQRISKDKDEQFRELLEEAFQNRSFWPDEYPTKAAYISALIERKHDTFENFVDLYKDLYAGSPYEFDIDIENLTPPQLDKHTHIAVSADLAKDVKQAATPGKAMFFDSDHMINSHMMLSTAIQKDGGITFMGETFINKEGDDVLATWLANQTVVTEGSPGHHYTPEPAPVDTDDPSYMPVGQSFFMKMVAASKTVSSHNKNGDTNYNESTLKAAETAHTQMIGFKNQIKNQKETSSTELPTLINLPDAPGEYTFQTQEQVESYEAMLDTYIGYYQQVLEAKGTSNKISPHFTDYKYQPSKAALEALKAKKAKKASEAGDDAPEISNTIKLGTKSVTVKYRPSAMANASFDFETGAQTLTGGETSKMQGMSISGHMYEIDFSGTKVYYRPYKDDVDKAQRGLLRVEHANWGEEDHQTIDDIFDVLRHTGLHLDSATEETMELQYWEHMVQDVLLDRVDGKKGKWGEVVSHVQSSLKDEMTKGQRLAIYREAWALAIGEERVEKANWKPQFSRSNIHTFSEDPEFTAGPPYWVRPDLTLAEMKEYGVAVSTTNLTYGGKAEDALPIALSGSMLSADERARYYGSLAKAGASSQSDKGKGSSGQVFTRPGSGLNGAQVVYHPRVYLRTTNYRSGGDSFGDASAKHKNAHWDMKNGAFHEGYEYMVDKAISVIDDVILLSFPNSTLRNQAIAAYKDRGITHLHGLPIEQIFVLSTSDSNAKAVVDHVWKTAIESEKVNENE